MLLPRFDQRMCFSRANFIAGPSYSAPFRTHTPLRLLPRRRIARRIGLATAEFAAGSFSGPALEEDDGGGSLPVVEKTRALIDHYHALVEKEL